MNPDFSKALAVAARLETDPHGRVHLPAALRADMVALTPDRERTRTELPPLTTADVARIHELRRAQYTYREIQRKTGIGYGRIAAVCQGKQAARHQ
jgi:hypothetical protein